MLLERADQLASLTRWWDEAAAGRGAVALVAGEAGAGKSELVRAFAAGRDTWTGWCDPLSTPRPLGPWHDIARAAGGPLAAALAGADPVEAAVIDLLAGRSQPVAVVVEDAHWADEASAALLLHLGRRLATLPALVVVTLRRDEVDAGHPLQRVLADLARQRHVVRRLDVAPLTPAAVAELAAGSGLDAKRVHLMTGGNAFFVTEVLAAGGELPASVADAVLGRLGALAPDARALADAVSIEPHGLEPALVVDVAGVPASTLDDAGLRGLLRSDLPALAFRHELARQAVYVALTATRRAGLHERLLDALLARGSVDHARLAHHATGSGDAARIVRHSEAAGREALARGANAQAVAFLSATLAADGLATGHRATLGLLLADAVGRTGDRAGETAAALAALADARRSGDAMLVARAGPALARAQWRAGDPAAARTTLDTAVASLRSAGPTPELAGALAVSAQHHMLARQRDAALAEAREAATVARTVGAEADEWRARLMEGTTLLICGEPDAGLVRLESCRVQAEAAGDRHQIAEVLVQCGSGAGEARRYEPALIALAALVSSSRERDEDYLVAYARSWQARIRLEQGHWDDAAELATGVLAEPAALIAEATALGVVGRLRVRRGDPRPEEPLDLALARPGLELQHRWAALCARAEQHWLAGEPETGRALLEPAYAAALDLDSPWARGELAYWLWRLGGPASRPPVPRSRSRA